MTPIKLTSTGIGAAEVIVMYDKITHIEASKTVFGDVYSQVHLGSDIVEVKETPDEVFKLLALALHSVDDSPQDPSLMEVEDDSELSQQKGEPNLSIKSLLKDSDERYGKRNDL